MEGMEDIAEEQLTVKSIAKLSDSEMVLLAILKSLPMNVLDVSCPLQLVKMMKKINYYLENPRDSNGT